MDFAEVKRRSATNQQWQWHIPSALDSLKSRMLLEDAWRENSGLVDKGPFAPPVTSVRAQELKRDDAESDAPEVEFAAPDTFFSDVEADERREWVERALEDLPPHQRVPLVLYHFEDMPYDEIAKKTRVSLSKVKTDILRGREALADPACGGYATFEGWVRDHNEGRAVRRLEYEAYAALAERVESRHHRRRDRRTRHRQRSDDGAVGLDERRLLGASESRTLRGITASNTSCTIKPKQIPSSNSLAVSSRPCKLRGLKSAMVGCQGMSKTATINATPSRICRGMARWLNSGAAIIAALMRTNGSQPALIHVAI